ncbi:MAG: hypothetical protein E3J86_03145 [Candidatus Thorarchaeota archaeon]|nr:MAG: hypothetical protein E3J86_03145 [Candidatus Thorarchaeota archaeon]
MTDRKTAHRNAFLLALVMVGLVIGFAGMPMAQAAFDVHAYTVDIVDAWTGWPWGYLRLTTTSYSSGNNLGTVVATQQASVWLPLTASCDGTTVSTIDSHRKLATGDFTVILWLIWPLIPFQTNYISLYKQVSYYGSGFSYLTWWN